VQYQGDSQTSRLCDTICGSSTCRDPDKEWIQLRYCINAEEVDWEIKDWVDDWKSQS
jgi:hypothetical protein